MEHKEFVAKLQARGYKFDFKKSASEEPEVFVHTRATRFGFTSHSIRNSSWEEMIKLIEG